VKNTDLQKFCVILADTYALYGKECPDGVKRIWWEALKNFDLADVSGALSRHIRNADTGQFIPKPADVVKAIEGSGDSRALIAWTDVDRTVRTRGPYVSVVFDDPLTHAVIMAMGGWVTLCRKSVDEWPFVQKDFMTRYKGCVNHPPTSYPRCLMGLADADCERRGLPSPRPPILIGSPERARQVYAQGEGPILALRHTPETIPVPALVVREDHA
jgi:hypothetical protein